ncbi:MAG: replication-associated recombination protein A [Candidatus Krumholzibacteriia bacterium]
MNGNLFPTDDTEPRSPPPPTAGNHPEGPRPLADRMRPRDLDEVVGQDHLLAPGGPLRGLVDAGRLGSLLFWGPPGCGKTTLARLLAGRGGARFLEYSAVAVGAKELKEVMREAEKLLQVTGRRTLLFLDEIHRFNKAQQDALLPWVERGDVVLVGATTENPSFELNSALLSRLRLFVLRPLRPADVRVLLDRALAAPHGLAPLGVRFTEPALDALAEVSEGDARLALGLLESVTAVAAERRAESARDDAGDDRRDTGSGRASGAVQDDSGEPDGATVRAGSAGPVDVDELAELVQHRAVRYDKAGEEHFNLISALHKSLRNSDPDAGAYWLTRVLEGGEDPLYVARRLVRFASEDVGLADPQALVQALAARDAVHFIGLPEGALALMQAVIYLALAPKSNALYLAARETAAEVRQGRNPPVPLHLRNAPTRLMREVGYGDGYVYAHDTPAGIAAMSCLPQELESRRFYRPGRRGFEQELARRLEAIATWRRRRQQDGAD